MISPRVIGMVWVIAGFLLLVLATGGESRNTPLLVVGILFVAAGAALVRRSSRRNRDR